MLELRNSKTISSGGNRYAIDAFIGAVQMSEDGQVWHDIKPGLVRDNDGWHVEGAPYYAELKDDGTRLFCPDRNERSRYFRLPTSSLLAPLAKNVRSTPAKLDGQLLPNQIVMTYAEWADIIVGFTNTGMTFSVLFKEAPTGEFEERFIFDAETAGLDINELLLEKRGLGIPRPRLIDSKVDAEERWLDWTFKNGQLELGFDLTGLKFPVLLQNTSIDEQVGTGTDDGYERESNGVMYVDGATYIRHESYTTSAYRYWGSTRWDGISIAQGSTIDVCYHEGYVYDDAVDDANFNIHFEKAASPATLTSDVYNITSRTRTAASSSWIEDSVASGGSGWYGSAISLITPLQEVVNAYYITAVNIITRPNTDAYKQYRFRPYESGDNTYGAKIHIEYTESGGGGTAKRGWWSK